MARPRPRPLRDDERALLDAIVAAAAPPGERAALRAQAAVAEVTGRCGCGCASVELRVGGAVPASAAESPLDGGTVLGDAGELLGGVLLFLEDGRLSGLELYGLDDEPIATIPSPDRIRPAA